ncbi:hypothetical protein B0H63DRAFT_386746 [Podospora didyma]|uniref:C2H2-type domain-containing protein n=1 Tax=Podospora didyma TaxID=330526 RepID=A0AAE0U8N7_9PEZI|nr:hypothetical protein B0H63DRAFT_386746 [Podospora didyma]
MASLKFIMDVNDDHQSDVRYTNKKDKDSKGPPANMAQLHEASTNTQPLPHPRHVSTSSGLAIEQDISQASPTAQNKRRGASTRGPKFAATAAPIVSSTSSSSLSTPTTRPSARRRSTTSNDSMDQAGGYGSASPSMGGGSSHHRPSNSPLRPMPPHVAASDVPMRFTPITGRVSRAKKGVPVHVCDKCKPAKTFTRAEHLRRHQLSHQTPQFPCTYPNCERAFHRPDLLARHQQRQYNKYSQRTSSLSHNQGAPSSPVVPGGQGGAPSSANVEPPPTPLGSTNAPTYAAHGSNPPTPHLPGAPGHYGRSGGASQAGFGSYPSPTVPMMNPEQGPSMPDYHMPYAPPRTGPPAICVVTQGLTIPEPPDLYHPNPTASPWSSSGDSTYSTPADDRYPRYWPGGGQTLLSPYPGAAPRGSPGVSMGMPAQALYMPTHFPTSHYPSGAYGSMMAPDIGGLDVEGTGHHHQALSGSSGGTFRLHHQHGNSISPVRSPTPPPNTSSHTSESIVIPSPALPHGIDGLGRRPKDMAAGTHMLGAQVVMGMGVLNGLASGFSADVSPGGDNGNGQRSGILTSLDLPLAGGECGASGIALALPLQRQVVAAIPNYLDAYWQLVHPTFPLVHRPTFEASPEDILRCAMAAVATQYLGNKEDRTRGNLLHEYAWQEAKRVPQWNLQTMQAILLCEYFARFRGRKAVTRPSKSFESLYARVSSLQSLATQSSSASLGGNDALWLVDTTAWSPDSSPATSDCSFFSSVTPTTTAGFSQRHLSTFPSTPWNSFPSSYASSASSPFGNTSSSPASSFAADLPPSFNNTSTISFSSDSRSRTPQQPWSSLFAPERYNPPPASLFSFQTQSQVAEQTYSQCLSNLQVLCNNPAMFDQAVLDSDQHTSVEDRWHNWVDAEARRRLLATCFFADGHAAIYQQQHRAREFDVSGMAQLPHIPLFGRSKALWDASSAHQWADVLASDPEAGTPTFVPPSEDLTPENVMALPPFDRMAVLGLEVLRLPSRQMPPVASLSAGNSPRLASNNAAPNSTDGVTGLSAAKATMYAARAIVGFLERAQSGAGPGGVGYPWTGDISDYWGLYVCALICWAFGHRARSNSTAPIRQRSSSGGSGGGSPVSRGSGSVVPGGGAATTADEEALSWLRMVAGDNVRPEDVVRARGRREAGGVVGLVRRRLESDCIGGRSRLYVDAVGVLRKLEEGANWKWF